MLLSNKYFRLPTSEPISLIHPLQSPTTSLGSTVGSYSDIAALETEISQPSLPKETGKAQVFQSASSAPINVSNPYSKDMEIADALATKVRDRLSEINGLAWRTFLLPVSSYALFYFIVYLATSPSAPAENGLEKLCNCSNTATFQRPLNSTLPTLISETEIRHEKALPLTTKFFYVLVCYNTAIVLRMFRTIREGTSSKIDMGMTLYES